ncbi:MAG: pyridoxal-phosphate dependent enzyme [Bacteroidales bacterium]|nr:pyridoxal-phosphate dependent enzyme [Bacteroidales bacterium]
MPPIPAFPDIRQAHERIAPHIHRTPVMTSSDLNELTGVSLFFKCENFQKVGAFKYRGATNAVLSLTDDEAKQGVATHSSGNHAAALALAARKRGIPCYVVMPETAPAPKIEAVKHYGAEITFCESTLKSREDTLSSIIEKTGAVVIHPYDNFRVICGQGTAAKELLEDISGMDCLFVPVGGGGLLSGSSISAKAMNPTIKVYGCEPLNADDACRSLKTGVLQPPLKPNTIADGLLTAMSELTFTIIKKNVDDIFTVSEDSIIKAMLLIWQRMKIIIEPSSAVAFAAVMENRDLIKGKRAGIILSGGNVDLLNLPFRSW